MNTVEDSMTECVRNTFRLKKQNETMKDNIIKDIITLFESKKVIGNQ